MTATSVDSSPQMKGFLRRHPIAAYFELTFALSWAAALAVASPHLIRHEPLPKLTGILMFPAMLLGPFLVGLLMRWTVDGRTGLLTLRSELLRLFVPARYYTALLIPPILVVVVLVSLTVFLSPAYEPNRYWLGVTFGIPAGLLEEIGWTGFAFPRMRARFGMLRASVLLGLIWSLWHLPVIDFLGAASPHGAYVFPFFLAFTLAMTAIRVLIGWLYTQTQSVLLAQLMHISSTGSLVVFGAPGLMPGQEVLWYAFYGLALWCVLASAINILGRPAG